MTNEFNFSADYNYTQSSAREDLLEALLGPDDAPYPWDMAEPESEAYFASGENLLFEDWSENEIATRAQTFFVQLEQIWCATTSAAGNPAVALDNFIQTNLQQRFGACVPQGWLDVIAHQAHLVFSTQRSIADQLVQCIQDLFPNWVEEDLQVLARPFACAMRGSQIEAIEFVLDSVRTRDWTTLSAIEQARVSLAIANYALTQMQLTSDL